MDEDVKKLKEEKCNKLIEIIKHGGEMNTPIPPPAPEKLMKKLTFEEAWDIAQKLEKFHTCRDCGHTGPADDFYQTKIHGVTGVCRKCVQRKRSKKFAENREAAANIGKHGVILDFSEYPDILETIKQHAIKNFRTVNNEILWRLVNG